MFFVNNVPPVCPDGDVFYDGGSKAIDELYLRVMGDGTPAVSCYDAFLHMRPSQMPNARAHAIGNANVVKAEVLFDFLRDRVLPARQNVRRDRHGDEDEDQRLHRHRVPHVGQHRRDRRRDVQDEQRRQRERQSPAPGRSPGR